MSSEESRDRLHSDDGVDDESAGDLLPAYALGVLEEDERQQVESELATSPELRAELQQLLGVVDALNTSHPSAAPSDALGQRILQSAGASRPPVSLQSRRRPYTRVLTVAAAVLILVMGGVIAILASELRDRERQIDDLQAQTARPSTDFTQPLVWSTISATHNGSEVSGYFCRTEDGNVGWIVIEGLRAGEDQVLQLWLVDDDQMVSGGMFATDEEGRGFGVVRAGVPVHTFSQIWITIEPPGGSPQPTSEPDLTAPIV